MNENWYALIIAIKFPVTVEQSFQILDKGSLIKNKGRKHLKLTDEELTVMVNLKDEGHTYKSIAEMYGMSWTAVSHRIKRFRKKVNKRC